MSYLLSEIALEMLGYKYYDIDGNYSPTSLGRDGYRINNNPANLNNEDPLEKILGLTDEDMANVDDNSSSSSSNNASSNAPKIAPQTSGINMGIKSSLNVIPSVSTVQNTSSNVPKIAAQISGVDKGVTSSLNVVPSVNTIKNNGRNGNEGVLLKIGNNTDIPQSVLKLIEHEYAKINAVILKNQNEYMKTNWEIFNSLNNSDDNSAKDIVQLNISIQKSKLENLEEIMHNFRKQVEVNVIDIHPDRLDKYFRTFRLNPTETRELNILRANRNTPNNSF